MSLMVVSLSLFIDQGNIFWNQGILYQTIGRNPGKGLFYITFQGEQHIKNSANKDILYIARLRHFKRVWRRARTVAASYGEP